MSLPLDRNHEHKRAVTEFVPLVKAVALLRHGRNWSTTIVFVIDEDGRRAKNRMEIVNGVSKQHSIIGNKQESYWCPKLINLKAFYAIAVHDVLCCANLSSTDWDKKLFFSRNFYWQVNFDSKMIISSGKFSDLVNVKSYSFISCKFHAWEDDFCLIG